MQTIKRTNGEILFEILLIENKIEYEPQKLLRISKVYKAFTKEQYKNLKKYLPAKKCAYIRPDYYLPKYNGYCEVVTNRQTLSARFKSLKQAIVEGCKITFYNELGAKIIFTNNALKQIGVSSNHDLFIIEDLEYKEMSVTRGDIFGGNLYEEPWTDNNYR